MAYWVVGGDSPGTHDGPYIAGGKRRVSHSDGSDYPFDLDDRPDLKRAKRSHFVDLIEPWRDERLRPPASPLLPPGPTRPHVRPHQSTQHYQQQHHHQHHHQRYAAQAPAPVEPIQGENWAFLIINQRSPSATPEVEGPGPCCMERTASGLSISSDTTHQTVGSADESIQLLSDDMAAWLVERHMADYCRRSPDSQHERILKSLIQPKSREADFSIDDEALESIFSSANAIFFHNRLSRRVTWDWSHSSSPQYQNQIIGTTALRPSHMGGFETLIVLSRPILKDRKYNRRLLISTFLHELIHSYLFICCGFDARERGGHTLGFRRIAATIDCWIGSDALHLKEMEADLERFRETEAEEEQEHRVLLASADERVLPHDLVESRYPQLHHLHAPRPRLHQGPRAAGPFLPGREYDDVRSQQQQQPLPPPPPPKQYLHYHERDEVSDGWWEHAVHDRREEDQAGHLTTFNTTGSPYVF